MGADDLDSFGWGCTTYYLHSLVEEIRRSRLGSRVALADYPLLTRLNPAVPFRTRGNGALSIHVSGDPEDLMEISEIASQILDPGARPGREPGLVSIMGAIDREKAEKIYRILLTDLMDLSTAMKILEKLEARIHVRGRGVVGALGSIAYHFHEGDCTYELIGYSQDPEEVVIDPDKVRLMDGLTRPLTFNNIDAKTGKILVRPSTGVPVTIGIRGETPQALVKALGILDPEGLEGYTIFRTNQGTDQHMIPRRLGEAKLYRTGLFKGRVEGSPKVLRGGDVILEISDGISRIRAAIYKEMGEGNTAARSLIQGDLVAIGGSVKPWILGNHIIPVINAETLIILELAEARIEAAPRCPRCGSSMESLGRGRGYRCRSCRYVDPKAVKIVKPLERSVRKGIYKPPHRHMKHLTKPVERIGMEKICRPSIVKDIESLHQRPWA